ncbi:MAG: FKBP-type peptidyl-prolyl cis-trans isomerase [Porphyromonas sp.]|nr:FKBP-type peptidyl-prolyl cis-trans isomerase [Porphyromonas sp.]
MRINKNLLIELQYVLHQVIENDEEVLVEHTAPEHPLTFIQGMGMMLPAFEAALVGLEEGDSFDFTLTPEEGYGEVDEGLILSLDKSIFMIDGKIDPELVYEGAYLPMVTGDGGQVQGLVRSIGEEEIVTDFNHPLAGATLHFTGTIERVSEPTPEEQDAILNPHSCGGGCSGCGDGSGSCGHDHSCC